MAPKDEVLHWSMDEEGTELQWAVSQGQNQGLESGSQSCHLHLAHWNHTSLREPCSAARNATDGCASNRHIYWRNPGNSGHLRQSEKIVGISKVKHKCLMKWASWMVGKILFSPCAASFQEAPSLMLGGPAIIFFKKYIFVKYAES